MFATTSRSSSDAKHWTSSSMQHNIYHHAGLRAAWTHHQTGPKPCTHYAGGGSMAGSTWSRTGAHLPPSCLGAPRTSCRRGGRRAQFAVIVWHLLARDEDYVWLRLALHGKKLRELGLRLSEPARRGQRWTAYAYSLTRTYEGERCRVEQTAIAYRQMTKAWRRRGRRVSTDASEEERSQRRHRRACISTTALLHAVTRGR
jgi:hypothetical protein